MTYVPNHEKERIDHVMRPPLPWRSEMLTECGLPAAGHPAITREEFIERVKKMGQQRSAMTTCMTCWSTAERHPSWAQDPVLCLSREVTWNHRNGVFKRELLAIAALISRHRDEFDELLEDQKEIVPLAKKTREVPRKRRW